MEGFIKKMSDRLLEIQLDVYKAIEKAVDLKILPSREAIKMMKWYSRIGAALYICSLHEKNT